MTRPVDEPVVTLAGLKARGWTDALVRRFLGEPDRRAPSRYARSAPPVRLYRLARVEVAEGTDEFRHAQAAAAERQRRARRAAARAAEDLARIAATARVDLPALSLAALQARAIDHYNRRGPREDDDGRWMPASTTSDPVFLARITVNYVRHQRTTYDRDLDSFWAKQGVRGASQVLRRRVYQHIAARWPALAEECARQWAARAAPEEGPLGELAAPEVDAASPDVVNSTR